jgi:hypothetical protein
MGEYKLIAFQPEHALAILGYSLRNENSMGYQDAEKQARLYAAAGEGFTFTHDGEIVGCGGIMMLRRGLGEAWTLVSSRHDVHPLKIHRTTKRMLEILMAKHSLRRVQASTLKSDPYGAQWLALLGFKCETPDGMAGFGLNGEIYYLYAKVRD